MKKYRNAYARLRCSSHRLEIEAGRFHKPVKTPIDESLCRICNVVENEFHFLFECPLHLELRTQYIDKYFYENPNHFKLKTLFQSMRENQIKKLSIYICKAFDLRNSILY